MVVEVLECLRVPPELQNSPDRGRALLAIRDPLVRAKLLVTL